MFELFEHWFQVLQVENSLSFLSQFRIYKKTVLHENQIS